MNYYQNKEMQAVSEIVKLPDEHFLPKLYSMTSIPYVSRMDVLERIEKMREGQHEATRFFHAITRASPDSP